MPRATVPLSYLLYVFSKVFSIVLHDVFACMLNVVFKSTKCEDLEEAWARHKKLFGWTIASVGNAKMDAKKYDYINSLHKHAWKHFRSYEVTAFLYKHCQQAAVHTNICL